MTVRTLRGPTAVAVVGCALIVAAAGLASPWFIRSPQQIAADTEPPASALLTAVVERRVLRDTVVLRGTVVADTVVEVTPSAGADATRAVVTAVRVKQGAQVRAGEVILEVSGRPLFALAGAIPVYRDLRPGSSGADVGQLQSALRALGHGTGGDRAGLFGAGTKAALGRLYDQLGYDVPTTGRADDDAVLAARRQVTTAERALHQAEEALALAGAATGASPSPGPPGSPDPAREAAEQVQLAREDLAEARRARDELIARTGPMLPAREVVFMPAFPAQVVQLSTRVGTEVAAPLVTLSSGALVVQAKVNPAERGLLAPGLKVEILSELYGVTAPGVISTIGELEQDEVAGQIHPMTVVPDQPLDRRLAGGDVRQTVEAASTAGEVLVVPLAAVSAGANGRTTVTTVGQEGLEKRVEVVAGVSGDGFVEVTPTSGSLEPGDRVVIGR